MRATNWKSVLMGMCVVAGFSFNGLSNTSIEGHYQGKNLYVQSPESEDGFGFCVTKVTVNGEVSTHSPQASAFQIDLTEFNIKLGDEVVVLFEHEDGCKPKLLNPEVLLPKSTFVLEEISCTSDGTLSWETTGESGELPYYIEQYKWNKWVVVGEINGSGNSTLSEYVFKLLPHSGKNMVRLSQIDNTGKKHVSKSVTFEADIPEPALVYEDGNEIYFKNDGLATETKYEIYDAYGNIVKKGKNSVIDCSNLKKGVYHVNFDNKHEKIIRK
ncbi:T9SS type A sorting domain-containing protein [Paracrocinitomix mangrovi]|uniref:T9SS type A sorting domain-containing protein n=1 Tax=Paracrocinitomix mangrovi TaxID=2862509 RepID=UPI001C8D4D3F|nr:T9SS type A sorting domain-containing protein [Paracrocinitomix mangrovi]UKN00436.1 T9SS type A sorting domain-containing protein [Paracrocinitomix mangrovi]